MDYIAIAQQHIAELYPIISYQNPAVNMLPPGAILGTWQYSIPHKMRFILAKDVEMATGVMPGDVARVWVQDQYKLPFRRRKEQLVSSYPTPLYAKRGTFGQCGYVDIKKAYIQILSLGYDVEYLRGKYMGANPQPVPRQIIEAKYCYSIAVAMSKNPVSSITVMGKEGTFETHPFNLYSNPCLYNLAQDTLNGIYSTVLDAVGEHCHYINTDGCIVDESHIDQTIDLIREWGFDATLKHFGDTEIRGVASYRVGTKDTRRFDPRAENFKADFMSKDDRDWLLRRWKLWSPQITSFYKP